MGLNFDVSRLENKILEIENKLSSVNDDSLLFFLKFDLYKLKLLVNQALDYKKYDVTNNFSDSYIGIENFILSSVDLISETFLNLSFSFDYFEYLKRLPNVYSFKKSISFAEYLELTKSFLGCLDEKYTYFLEQLISEEKIFVCPHNISNSSSVFGQCFCLSDADLYIVLKFLKRQKDTSDLVHELVHAYDNSRYNDPIINFKKSCSVFQEALPVAFENIFANYLFNTKYKINAIKEQRDFIDNFVFVAENCLESLYSISKENVFKIIELVSSDKSQTWSLLYDAKYLYSYLLGMYLTNLYNIDKESFVNEVNWLLDNIGVVSDREIYNRYGFDRLSHAPKEFTNSYLRKLKKS